MHTSSDEIPAKLNWHVVIETPTKTHRLDAVDVWIEDRRVHVRTIPYKPAHDEKGYYDTVFRQYFNDGDMIIPFSNILTMKILRYIEVPADNSPIEKELI